MKKLRSTLTYLTIMLFIQSCGGGDGPNLFSVSDDQQLGSQFDDEIENSEEYNILPRDEYPEAYEHLDRIRDNVLNSGNVDYEDEFVWEVHIIEDDDTLNAFATPGGYLYFYTGLIKFLDTEDEFAGVMGHEMAHSAERHSTTALTRQYGISILVELLLGDDQNLLTDITQGLIGLSFSRNAESDADYHSVLYLADTEYDCTGAAGFFEKLSEGNNQSPPEFISTHPNPENRVADIEAHAEMIGCSTELSGNDYQSFKDSLP